MSSSAWPDAVSVSDPILFPDKRIWRASLPAQIRIPSWPQSTSLSMLWVALTFPSARREFWWEGYRVPLIIVTPSSAWTSKQISLISLHRTLWWLGDLVMKQLHKHGNMNKQILKDLFFSLQLNSSVTNLGHTLKCQAESVLYIKVEKSRSLNNQGIDGGGTCYPLYIYISSSLVSTQSQWDPWCMWINIHCSICRSIFLSLCTWGTCIERGRACGTA